jgi:uncharacterized protein
MSFFSNATSLDRSTSGGLDLSAIMRSVYLWLALGLAVAFGTSFLLVNAATSALAGATTPAQVQAALQGSLAFNPVVSIVSLIAFFIMAFAFGPVVMRAKPMYGIALYLAFAALFGLMISSLLTAFVLTERVGAIYAAFISTSAMFGAMTVLGYTTKIDLSRMGSILIMALIGMFVASIVNIFLQSGVIMMIISYVGVIVFAGLTAYDTQWIKNNAAQVAAVGDGDAAQRIALYGAFHLFSNFMNMFIYLLQIFGMSGSND